MATTVVTWVHTLVCGLQGHENLLQFARGRMYLKCVSCGHESPGWEIKEQSAVPAAQPERRRRLVPHFAGERRAA
jgi:hypothetical protein